MNYPQNNFFKEFCIVILLLALLVEYFVKDNIITKQCQSQKGLLQIFILRNNAYPVYSYILL